MKPESDGTVEALREIRDELRNVRSDLLGQLRNARTGVRTERFDRAARWRMAATAGTGALALAALLVALRAGDRAAPAAVVLPPATVAAAAASPTGAPAVAPVPVAPPAPAPALTAAQASAAKPAPRAAGPAPAGVTPVKRRAKPALANPTTAPSDDDETMAFSPPAPRRVRVHKMSYGPVESEPAKL